MFRRGLDEQVVRAVLKTPQQKLSVRSGRDVFQSKVALPGRVGLYLVRVVVDTGRDPPEVVTAYFTSRIDKYWSPVV